MQFGPVMSPRLPVRVRLLPGQFQNLKMLWVLAGSQNDRNLSFRAFEFGVALHVNLLWAVQYEYSGVERYACIRILYVSSDKL